MSQNPVADTPASMNRSSPPWNRAWGCHSRLRRWLLLQSRMNDPIDASGQHDSHEQARGSQCGHVIEDHVRATVIIGSAGGGQRIPDVDTLRARGARSISACLQAKVCADRAASLHPWESIQARLVNSSSRSRV